MNRKLTTLLTGILICTGSHAEAPKRYAGKSLPQIVQVSVSPISMIAIEPGIDITPKVLERWAAQSDLPMSLVRQIIPERRITRLDTLNIDVSRERRPRSLVEFLDGAIFKSSTAGALEKRASDIDWSSFANSGAIFDDVTYFAGLDKDGEAQFRENLSKANLPNQEGAIARTSVYRTFSDARLGASRASRAYKQLYEILSTELRTRESESGIGLSFELRTGGRELSTISPLSRADLECPKLPKQYPSMLFSQRRRDCNEQGICRVESVTGMVDSRELFMELYNNGRQLLDQCNIALTLLVDGKEVSRILPGKFTSHVVVPFTSYTQ